METWHVAAEWRSSVCPCHQRDPKISCPLVAHNPEQLSSPTSRYHLVMD